MIEVGYNLTGDLLGALDGFEKAIQEKVVLSGVAAMARVIYDEVKINTSGARAHAGRPGDPPDSITGTLDKAIYRAYAMERSAGEVKIYKVSVNKSKAPHWHLVEYGHSRAPAHPYIRPAASKMPAAIAAGKERMRDRLAEIIGERMAAISDEKAAGL